MKVAHFLTSGGYRGALTKAEALAAGLLPVTVSLSYDAAHQEAIGFVSAGIRSAVVAMPCGYEAWRESEGFRRPGHDRAAEIYDDGYTSVSFRRDIVRKFRAWCLGEGFLFGTRRVQPSAIFEEIIERKWKRKAGVPFPVVPPSPGEKWGNIHLSMLAIDMIDGAVARGIYASRSALLLDIASGNFYRKEGVIA
jgi:hypothetical protein